LSALKSFVGFVLVAGVIALTAAALFKFLTDRTWGQVWDWIVDQLPNI